MDAFDVLELLGAGGCASVHRVRRKSDGALFALKRVSAASSASSKQQERLRTEQLILRTLRSPFVCRGGPPLIDGRNTEPQSFLLEFIDGKPLCQCVWSYPQTRRFPERVAKFVAAQIVLALAEVHAHGFVHRDLKSGNVLVDAHGFVKVIDFGFAKQIGQNGEAAEGRSPTIRTHSFCGTHYVMAPEIFQRRSHGFEADWWSLGVVIYEMVVGRPPWEYKPSAEAPIGHYFESIAQVAASLQAEEFELQSRRSPSSAPLDPWSPELISLLRGLLTMEPEQRLGCHGAAEVMAHPWFHDTDWDLLRAKESRGEEIVSPYNLQTDFVVHRDDMATPPMRGEPWSTSSAESIDPEDNEKYFADF